MANTYTFTSVTGGSAKYKVNGGLSHMIKDSDWLDQLGPSIIRMQGHNGTYDMDTTVDTIVVNGTTVTGGASTMDTIFDALNPLFRKANSGNGGTGGVTAYSDLTGKPDLTVYATKTGTETLSKKSIPSVLTPATDQTSIEAWGDSHTAGAGVTPFTTTLATLSGLTVNNNGVGGETSAQVKTRFDAATTAQKARPTIIWVGYNDYNTDNTYATVKTNIAAMVAALGHTSYMVIGDLIGANPGFLAGEAGWINKMAFNRYLAATYKHHFFDVHSFIMQYYDATSPADIGDYITDREPTSLRIDAQHLTAAANVLIGTEINRRLRDLGIGTAPLTFGEIANASISPVNVGWGVKAPGMFGYLEADKINLRNNGTLMQEGVPFLYYKNNSALLGYGAGLAQRISTAVTNLYNVNLGYQSGDALTAGPNVTLGYNSGRNLTTGTNNVVIGMGVDAASSFNSLNISNILFGTGLNTTGTTLPTSGRLGIRVSNLNSTLTLGGSLATPINAKTAAYTLTESDYTINVTGATTATITLPTAVGCNGRIYVIKNSGTGVVTVGTTSSQLIDAATTYALGTQYKYVTVQSNNSAWLIIGNN